MTALQDFDISLARTNANKHRIFVKRSGDGSSGFERSIEADFPNIAITPKFRVDRTDPVFTIGSCFARNIEHVLVKQGFDSITSRCTISDELYELTGIGARNGALNAYTPHSMLDLLSWNGRQDRMTAGALRIGDDLWADMLVTGLRNLSGEEMASIRHRILATYDELARARTVIITLGYTESWYDTVDHMFVNRSPAGAKATLKHGQRYQFMNADAASVCLALDRIVSLIRSRTGDQAKIVLTTSPVPLHGTFTDRDVVCANLYSKATLLSCAVATAAKHDFVDYFPSYEMVTLSTPADTWESDGIHVKPALIEKVLDRFTEAYVE